MRAWYSVRCNRISPLGNTLIKLPAAMKKLYIMYQSGNRNTERIQYVLWHREQNFCLDSVLHILLSYWLKQCWWYCSVKVHGLKYNGMNNKTYINYFIAFFTPWWLNDTLPQSQPRAKADIQIGNNEGQRLFVPYTKYQSVTWPR